MLAREAGISYDPQLDGFAGPDARVAGVVVRGPAMRVVYKQAARAALANISVLLLGETGVGKKVLARTIHAHSPRSKGPSVGINCAALPDTCSRASSSARAGRIYCAR